MPMFISLCRESLHTEITMDNSARIEAATRGFVGQTLTGKEITRLVNKMFPESTQGIYPGDVAYAPIVKDGKRTLEHRGGTAYGDGVLQYMGSDAFKVLPSDQIVRREKKARGRNASKLTDEQIDAALAKKQAAAAQAVIPAAVHTPKADGKADGKAARQ
jgi:hypothetical protein